MVSVDLTRRCTVRTGSASSVEKNKGLTPLPHPPSHNPPTCFRVILPRPCPSLLPIRTTRHRPTTPHPHPPWHEHRYLLPPFFHRYLPVPPPHRSVCLLSPQTVSVDGATTLTLSETGVGSCSSVSRRIEPPDADCEAHVVDDGLKAQLPKARLFGV